MLTGESTYFLVIYHGSKRAAVFVREKPAGKQGRDLVHLYFENMEIKKK